MKSLPRKNATASGRRRPCVSEISPIRDIPTASTRSLLRGLPAADAARAKLESGVDEAIDGSGHAQRLAESHGGAMHGFQFQALATLKILEHRRLNLRWISVDHTHQARHDAVRQGYARSSGQSLRFLHDAEV